MTHYTSCESVRSYLLPEIWGGPLWFSNAQHDPFERRSCATAASDRPYR